MQAVNAVMDEFTQNGIELRGQKVDVKRAIPKDVSVSLMSYGPGT